MNYINYINSAELQPLLLLEQQQLSRCQKINNDCTLKNLYSLLLFNVCLKFCDDISNGSGVIMLTDRQTNTTVLKTIRPSRRVNNQRQDLGVSGSSIVVSTA